jgi:mannose-1-phosphate guanylyltransferase
MGGEQFKRVGVVMAGGHGERFWPLSRPDRPKQLLHLTDSGRSMLEDAVQRISPIVNDVVISTSLPLSASIAATGVVESDQIFGEPARRSTLGALCWTVANLIGRGDRESTVAVVTADHMIGDDERFRNAAIAAMGAAEQKGGIVTLGIRPTRPEIGYGYIEIEQDLPEDWAHLPVYPSSAFREKPDELTAAAYLISGRHLWNGGMFFFTIPGFMREMKHAAPREYEILERMAHAIGDGDMDKAAGIFLHLTDTSIDYALLEKAPNVSVIPVDFPWDDVGAWDSLDRTKAMDFEGNVTWGTAYKLDVTSSIIFNDDPDRTVGLLGLKDVIVVNTKHAVLVCHKSQAQQVKQLVALIAEGNKKEKDG